MIIIAPSKALPQSQKESGGDGQTEEGDKGVKLAPAAPAFEEGHQATQDKLQEVILGSDEEPQPTSSIELCHSKKKKPTSKFLKQN